MITARDAWAREGTRFARAFSGAFLFGVPLLLTMEMWWIGASLPPWKLLAFLACAFLANLGLAHISGFKEGGRTLLADAEEAVESLAVGIAGAGIVLLVLARIGPGEPLYSSVGQIALQAIPLSIGASLANAVLVAKGQTRTGDRPAARAGAWRAALTDLGASAVGALFIAFNIAPTEEVEMLALELSAGHRVALILLSLAAAYGIVFASGFGRHEERRAQPGPFQQPATETALSYVVALSVSFTVLFLLDKVQPGVPPSDVLARTIVLAFPASIGGAAGRLAV